MRAQVRNEVVDLRLRVNVNEQRAQRRRQDGRDDLEAKDEDDLGKKWGVDEPEKLSTTNKQTCWFMIFSICVRLEGTCSALRIILVAWPAYTTIPTAHRVVRRMLPRGKKCTMSTADVFSWPSSSRVALPENLNRSGWGGSACSENVILRHGGQHNVASE